MNEFEEQIQIIIEKTLGFFNENCIGPIKYLNTYEPFKFIIDGSAKEETIAMFYKKPFPLLEVISYFCNRHIILNKKVLLTKF